MESAQLMRLIHPNAWQKWDLMTQKSVQDSYFFSGSMAVREVAQTVFTARLQAPGIFPRCLCAPWPRHGSICFDAVKEIQLNELWPSDCSPLPSAHLFHWSIFGAESRSNYFNLLALLLWKCLYFKIPGISISKMSVFVFASLHLHLYILAITVSSDGRTDDRRALICFSRAGTRIGGASDTQSSLTITPNFISSP